MAEIILSIEQLRYIARELEAKRTDRIKVSIEDKWFKVEVLKTGERAEVKSLE